jgi:hypothetical protein
MQYLHAHIFGKIKLSFEIVDMNIHLLSIYHLSSLLSDSQSLLHIINACFHVESYRQFIEWKTKFIVI